MARILFGCSPADFVVDVQTGRPVPNFSMDVYDARTGGSAVTDLLDIDEAAITVVTSDDVGLVAFYGPDDYTDPLWLDTGLATRVAIIPVGGAGAIVGDWIAESLIDAKGDLVLGTAADTAGILSAASDGFLLALDSGETVGARWVDPTSLDVIPASLLEAKGDLVVRTSSGIDILSAGTDGQYLQADSTEDTGLKWESIVTPAFPVINVKSYGAEGDGEANDTVAIQQAIDAAAAIGAAVFFPAGVYMVAATTAITHPNGGSAYACLTLDDNVILYGEGRAASILKMIEDTGDSCDIVYAQNKIDIKIADLGFDASDARTLTDESTCIQLDSCAATVISNVEATGGNSEGVYLYNCDYSQVHNLYSHHNGDAGVGAAGLHLDMTDGAVVSNLVSQTNGLYGLILSTSSNTSVVNATLIGNGTAGILVQTSSTGCSFSNIVANDNLGQGISVINSTNIQFLNTRTVNNDANGLYTYNSQTVRFVSAFSTSNTEAGLRLDNAADRVFLDGYSFADNGTVDSYTTSGAVIQVGVYVVGTPTDGQALIWSASNSRWEPGTVSTADGVDRWVYYDGDAEEWPARPMIDGHVIWRSVGFPDAGASPNALDMDDWEPDPDQELP